MHQFDRLGEVGFANISDRSPLANYFVVDVVDRHRLGRDMQGVLWAKGKGGFIAVLREA